MKQFQIAYKNDETLREELKKIRRWRDENRSYTTLFRIYSTDMEPGHIKHVCDLLDEEMPDALYFGCTSHGNIMDGALEMANIILTCTVFEYETTHVEVLHLPFIERSVSKTVKALKAFCDENPWVSSVEIHANMLGMSVREFCEEMSTLRSDIQIFGGGAYNPKMDDTSTLVFSKGHDFSDKGIIFLLLGGSDLHTYSTYIVGWKPFSRHFTVTKSHRATLYELDNAPAFDVYQRYLKISKGDNIIANTLEFPLFMDYKGVDVLRCPLGLNQDGSLVMATEVPEGSHVRLSFGDPRTILKDIRHDGQTIVDFRPDVIQVFSCAARKAFWGDENVSDETSLFNSIAPASGFYTSGEFLRFDGNVRNFNITLVLAAMREGEPKNGEIVNLWDTKLENIESEERIPLISRFSSFIDVITAELEESNRKLVVASITDGLTGLYNRAEIERRIRSAVEDRTQNGSNRELCLIMLDIDDFKRINDIYGHKEGDRVIKALSDVLKEVVGDVPSASVGRWGGEEFMALLPDTPIGKAGFLAERIRAGFEAAIHQSAGRQTVSVGVIRARDGESADSLYSRVDKALYMAKANGKNQVVTMTPEM